MSPDEVRSSGESPRDRLARNLRHTPPPGSPAPVSLNRQTISDLSQPTATEPRIGNIDLAHFREEMQRIVREANDRRGASLTTQQYLEQEPFRFAGVITEDRNDELQLHINTEEVTNPQSFTVRLSLDGNQPWGRLRQSISVRENEDPAFWVNFPAGSPVYTDPHRRLFSLYPFDGTIREQHQPTIQATLPQILRVEEIGRPEGPLGLVAITAHAHNSPDDWPPTTLHVAFDSEASNWGRLSDQATLRLPSADRSFRIRALPAGCRVYLSEDRRELRVGNPIERQFTNERLGVPWTSEAIELPPSGIFSDISVSIAPPEGQGTFARVTIRTGDDRSDCLTVRIDMARNATDDPHGLLPWAHTTTELFLRPRWGNNDASSPRIPLPVGSPVYCQGPGPTQISFSPFLVSAPAETSQLTFDAQPDHASAFVNSNDTMNVTMSDTTPATFRVDTSLAWQERNDDGAVCRLLEPVSRRVRLVRSNGEFSRTEDRQHQVGDSLYIGDDGMLTFTSSTIPHNHARRNRHMRIGIIPTHAPAAETVTAQDAYVEDIAIEARRVMIDEIVANSSGQISVASTPRDEPNPLEVAWQTAVTVSGETLAGGITQESVRAAYRSTVVGSTGVNANGDVLHYRNPLPLPAVGDTGSQMSLPTGMTREHTPVRGLRPPDSDMEEAAAHVMQPTQAVPHFPNTVAENEQSHLSLQMPAPPQESIPLNLVADELEGERGPIGPPGEVGAIGPDAPEGPPGVNGNNNPPATIQMRMPGGWLLPLRMEEYLQAVQSRDVLNPAQPIEERARSIYVRNRTQNLPVNGSREIDQQDCARLTDEQFQSVVRTCEARAELYRGVANSDSLGVYARAKLWSDALQCLSTPHVTIFYRLQGADVRRIRESWHQAQRRASSRSLGELLEAESARLQAAGASPIASRGDRPNQALFDALAINRPIDPPASTAQQTVGAVRSRPPGRIMTGTVEAPSTTQIQVLKKEIERLTKEVLFEKTKRDHRLHALEGHVALQDIPLMIRCELIHFWSLYSEFPDVGLLERRAERWIAEHPQETLSAVRAREAGLVISEQRRILIHEPREIP